MSSTVGHALCGIDCAMAVFALGREKLPRINKEAITLFAVLANLPDVDLLIGYLITGNQFSLHGRFTHSLLFAMAVGLLCGVIHRRRYTRWAWGIFSIPVASHIFVDTLTGPVVGRHATKGYALLWPLSEHRFSSPITVFPGPRYDTIERILSIHNLMTVGYEVLFFGFWGVVMVWGPWRKKLL